MANMEHCRFNNTLIDLLECKEALANGEFKSLSKAEKINALELIDLCKEIAEMFEDDELEDMEAQIK